MTWEECMETLGVNDWYGEKPARDFDPFRL